jgi:transposase InsO family protein
MPVIGGLKLYQLTRSVLGDALCMGRDKFLNLLHRHKLIIPPRKSRHTTKSDHVYFKYPNLVKELVVSYVNQLWVSDITYIYTTEDKFCYLHLVTDAFSRMIIGHVLSPTLEAKYTIEALQQAIAYAGGGNLCGTIHHSDRGVQYCCDDYTLLLKAHHIRISMTEDSNPTDNGLAERVNGIIKNEFLEPLPTPRTLQEAWTLVDHAVRTYNTLRPHINLEMRTPAQVYEVTNNFQKLEV